MRKKIIRKKFGDDYQADAITFKMGIDRRFARHFANRFKDLTVLETCTGAGFTTMALAETAKHVITVEINPKHCEQAVYNVEKAGLKSKVTFLCGDILDNKILDRLPHIEAGFIDPDWADEKAEHTYKFIDSTTRPPADELLDTIFKKTANIALILPPFIKTKEFNQLPDHELERLYMGDNLELFCLYFGNLTNVKGETEFHIPKIY